MKQFSNFLALLVLIPGMALAIGNPGKHSRQKKISKAYIVNSDAGIDIENSYGNIFVTTWDEEKIELEVLIKVSGNDEKWVEKRIGAIDVEINAMKNLVSAKTRIGNSGKKSGKSNSMEIHYTLKIPRKGIVKLDNKYGDILAGNLAGATHIKCQYGNVTLEKLLSPSNQLLLQYVGKAQISYMKGGVIESSYSKSEIGEYENLVLNSNYSEFILPKGGNFRADSNYDKLSIGSIGNLKSDGNYLVVKIDKLFGNLDLNSNYSSLKIAEVHLSAGNINLGGNYTNFDIGYSPEYPFDLEVNTKYTESKFDPQIQVIKSEASGRKMYRGFYKKSGQNKIAIQCDYGSVRLVSGK